MPHFLMKHSSLMIHQTKHSGLNIIGKAIKNTANISPKDASKPINDHDLERFTAFFNGDEPNRRVQVHRHKNLSQNGCSQQRVRCKFPNSILT